MEGERLIGFDIAEVGGDEDVVLLENTDRCQVCGQEIDLGTISLVRLAVGKNTCSTCAVESLPKKKDELVRLLVDRTIDGFVDPSKSE